MVVGIIYRYISPSGKSYIGQTTNENIRREHWNTLGPYAGRKINRAREKYGLSSFTYEVIERNTYSNKDIAREELNKLEIYYIGLYDSYRHGYNCTIGGDSTLGCVCTEDTKNKISRANRGKRRSIETKLKLSRIGKGRKFSQEHKGNIGKALKGRPCTWSDKIVKAKCLKEVIQYNTDGQFVNMYHSVREASFRTRISMASIYKCVNGEHNTAGGFIWKYKNNQL